jgi:hypothetical protein
VTKQPKDDIFSEAQTRDVTEHDVGKPTPPTDGIFATDVYRDAMEHMENRCQAPRREATRRRHIQPLRDRDDIGHDAEKSTPSVTAPTKELYLLHVIQAIPLDKQLENRRRALRRHSSPNDAKLNAGKPRDAMRHDAGKPMPSVTTHTEDWEYSRDEPQDPYNTPANRRRE